MKVKWNPKTGLPDFIFEEADYMDAVYIGQMVGGKFSCQKCGTENENHAWKILEGYFKSAREAIIEAMKIGLRNRATRSLTDLKAAKLEGFDEAGRIPQRIIMQAELMKIKDQKLKEVQNAGSNSDPDVDY